jgi:hypothetical protein
MHHLLKSCQAYALFDTVEQFLLTYLNNSCSIGDSSRRSNWAIAHGWNQPPSNSFSELRCTNIARRGIPSHHVVQLYLSRRRVRGIDCGRDSKGIQTQRRAIDWMERRPDLLEKILRHRNYQYPNLDLEALPPRIHVWLLENCVDSWTITSNESPKKRDFLPCFGAQMLQLCCVFYLSSTYPSASQHVGLLEKVTSCLNSTLDTTTWEKHWT